MMWYARRTVVRSASVWRLFVVPFCIALWISSLRAQRPSGALAGIVTDSASNPITGAIVRVVDLHTATRTGDDGRFRLDHVAAGTHAVRVNRIGFAADSFSVDVVDGETTIRDVVLRTHAVGLARVTVTARRLGETKEMALTRQKNADNIVTVLSGDEIRALPNYNAAEAAGRIPGVSLERDEGEGKFVQVRGTEPRLSNVTIDGVHIPGTERGDRIVKLDDVPSDILGAIEVSKTLTADMDADAIGGSVNLVTKVPESGPPKGYIAGQFGQITLSDHQAGQGGFAYGGRLGEREQFGFLIGGSAERNNRGINDVEPGWSVDDAGRSYPVEWSQRDYAYDRRRYGLGGDLDYRFDGRSSVSVRGLWSLFQNYGDRYVYDIASSGDSLGAGTTGIGTGVALTREVQRRTPKEQLYGFTAGAKHDFGALTLDYTLTFSGTRQEIHDYRTSPYTYAGTDAGNMAIRYDFSNRIAPTYQFLSATQAAEAANPALYTLSGFSRIDGLTTGRDLGGAFNALWHYRMSDHPAGIKIGARLRDETKNYQNNSQKYSVPSGMAFTLAQALGGFSDPNFYSNVTRAYQLGPVPSLAATNGFENTDFSQFVSKTNPVQNQLSSFNGTEKIYAAYVMNDVDVGALHVNIGLRMEATHIDYLGHAAPDGKSIVDVPGSQQYTDLFPSVQFRYATDASTNVRLAFTRGIARPNYSDLAPSLRGTADPASIHDYSNLQAGNPNLRAQHSWNYDLLAEHFLPFAGVISGGVFYKQLSDVILTRNFIYSGPIAAFQGFYGTTPQNGGTGHLWGIEADWVQHLTFLPGLLSGVGFDVNWTHTGSRVLIDSTGRHGALLRQPSDIGNAALLYDRGPISGRLAWTYNGTSISSYGDGTNTANGDTYFYPHGQLDGSILYNLTNTVQLQFQVLNINNEVFGFFNGTPGNRYDIQREYYGRTFYLGAKYGIGAY